MRGTVHRVSLTPPRIRTTHRLGVSPWTEVERLLTPQELAPIRAVFTELDRDGDGWLSAKDLQRSVVADGIISPHDRRACRRVKEWLWEVDEDGDGNLSFADFALLYGRIRKGLRKAEPHRLCNYLIFKLIDVDHDGVLKIDEIYSYLCHILDKDMANYNMSRVLGASVDSPDTARISPAAWMRVLDSAIWENMSPVLDSGRTSNMRQLSQKRQRDSRASIPSIGIKEAAAASCRRADHRGTREVPLFSRPAHNHQRFGIRAPVRAGIAEDPQTEKPSSSAKERPLEGSHCLRRPLGVTNGEALADMYACGRPR